MRTLKFQLSRILEKYYKWLLLSPGLVFLLFLITPFALLIYLSMRNWIVYRGPWWESSFVGFQNFAKAFYNQRFLTSIARTLVFVTIVTSVELSIGGILAWITHKEIKGRKFFNTLFLLPMMIIPVVIGYTFETLFYAKGPVNGILSLLIPVGVRTPWLAKGNLAFITIILADIWNWTPLMFLILLSGFTGLPKEPLQAARVMGASSWQIFKSIQLPLLRPIIVVAIVIRFMESLKVFDKVMLLTRGGPGTSTETLSIYLYRVGWEHLNVSQGAAMSLIVFVLTIVLIIIGIRLLIKERQRGFE